MNRSDPSGKCVEVLWVYWGGGPETSSTSFILDPGAGANAVVNIGPGASFGLSDTIANWLSPGASCTIPQNGVDQFIGGAVLQGLLAAGGAADALSAEEVTSILEDTGLNPEFASSFEGAITQRMSSGWRAVLLLQQLSRRRGKFPHHHGVLCPKEAVKSLELPSGNNAAYRQVVTAIAPTTVLEGGIAGGGEGITQTLVLDQNAFYFGTGAPY
ncbi:MAG: hypothetical protein HKL80_05020 [Acidimicrobiales bacterium]|nr:hypothetical protein [Acidimicrobiales bacterium]